MSKKIYGIITIFISIMFIFLVQNKVYAANATLSASATKIETGTSVTITADIDNAATWALDISSTGGNLNKNNDRVGETESGDNEEDITITLGSFSVDVAGKYIITLSGYVVDGDTLTRKDVSGQVTIEVEDTTTKPSEESENDSGTTTTEPETIVVTKSSEARLKNLGIEPYDFSGFSKNPNKEEWNAGEVPNTITEVEIYAKAKHDKATIEGTGKVQLKEGNNTFEVKVTAEDGKTTKTYKLTIKRRTADEENIIQSEARLSNLGIRPEEYDFKGFDKDKTEYTIEIPNEVKEIEVYAEAIDADAQITGIGEFTLEEGENTLVVEVISPNGTKMTYTIKVTRPEKEVVDEKSGLLSLSIAGLTFSPKFDSEQYEYKLDLTEDLISLDINANPVNEDWTIEIVGNDNLKQGENTITILVTNKETEEVATYQIIVNKNVETQEIVTSWLKPSTWGKEEKIKLILIAVIIVLIISAIILKVKMSKEEKINHNIDLPGAEELDKAIAEHQELSEEEIIPEETIDRDVVKENYLEEISKNRTAESSIIFEEDIVVTKPKRRGKHF